MSAASCLLTEDQFLCSICLDVFTDPVTIPCGHNFCKTCITIHWDKNVLCQCPNCKKTFNIRPELQVNTFISEMAAQFRQSAQQKASSSSSEQQVSKPGEVPCDVCTGTKLKALKSCLVCLASYCETHLEPHLTAKQLKRHQLIDPVENLEDRMCTKHDKLLELFCKTDQMCVCMLCTVLDHQGHYVVPLKEECEGKKAELGKRDAEIQQMIQKRRLKIEEMKRSVQLSKKDADREIAAGVQVFRALKESVERSQAELMDTIKEKQRETEKQAEGFIKELEQEISELEKRSSEVKMLSSSKEKLLNFFQSFPSLNTAPPTKDWTGVSVRPPSYEGTVVRAVNQLEETLSKQMKKLLEAELKRVQQYAVDVTLDPDTAHPNLILSDDGKQVNCGDVKKNLPDNPERFDCCVCVLAKQSFSSGRFYYEVQVKEKTEWDLGVARESINRKGKITASPQNGYWTIRLRNENEYEACAGPPVRLSLKHQPEKVGVFVDYEEGLVSFYDVDAAALIYSFTGCCFTQKLYPFFSPSLNYGGKNSAPLIISPVSHIDRGTNYRSLSHRDLVPGAAIPKGRLYSISAPKRKAMNENIIASLEADLGRPSSSPTGARFFFVGKKDGSLQPCINYSLRNDITIENRYLLPLMTSIFDQLQQAKIFTKLDLRNAYHLIRIREGDQWKTGFNTPSGHYEYSVVPFGLTNAPAVFQAMINDVLRDFLDRFVYLYLDDILIYSPDLATHRDHVNQVLKKLLKHNLYVKAEKSAFHAESVSFLDFIVAPGKVQMDPAKISAVAEWPTPDSRKKVQQFLGFANYTRFVRGFSTIAAPLHALNSTQVPFRRSPEAGKEFQTLKHRFTTAPILTLPDPQRQFVVEVDASNDGVGAVLSQRSERDGKMHPCAFLSRRLSRAERNYDVGRDLETPSPSSYHDSLIPSLRPTELRPQVIHWAHTSLLSCHPGVKRAMFVISRRFWWPAMETEVWEYIEACLVCARNKTSSRACMGLLHSLPIPPRPWSDIAIDFVTGLPVSQGNNTVLTMVDRFSKMVKFISLPKLPSAKETAEVMMNNVFRVHGFSKDIVSDRGPQAKASLKSGYHLEANGQTERLNQQLETGLRCVVHQNPSTWSKHLVWMSAASCLLTEDPFLCSICLDVFTDPVTIPCGHNFCKTCITKHWSDNVPCQCPNCKEVFHTRPKLQVNTFISEMAAQFRQSAQQKASSSSSEQHVSKPGEVPCDVCTGTKLKALKSCLECLASYCETHLEPHLTMSGLKKHQLIDPVENLEDRMCTKHDKLLELFCKTDQMCVCMLCTVLDHKTHDVVPLKEEYEGTKAELGKRDAEIQQMIQKRRLKIEEMKRSVQLSKKDADREIAAGVQVFRALKESVERSQAELMDTIKEKQRETEKQAEDFIKELEREISELEKRSSEVEQLSQSEDHLHLLQSFPSLNTAPPTKDWTGVSIRPPSYEGTVVRAVNQLEETLSKQMKKLFEAELKRVQQYAVDVTLDPDTAHPELILSDDGKQVKHGYVEKNLPDNPERFDYCVFVLANQSFSSGRFYYEVQVKGKTEWNLGVAKESINRKGNIKLSPQDGCWTIWLRNINEYEALAGPPVRLSLKCRPRKVGVFVDYEEGLVSFYDVDAAALIYSFTGCCFTQKLYPYFCPSNNYCGKNSAPLIIPVNHTE
ncbi:LOW QUALITY PROTEIN: uncharacterized protein AB9X84_012845 [Acanthopagrus schlegelii]